MKGPRVLKETLVSLLRNKKCRCWNKPDKTLFRAVYYHVSHPDLAGNTFINHLAENMFNTPHVYCMGEYALEPIFTVALTSP